MDLMDTFYLFRLMIYSHAIYIYLFRLKMHLTMWKCIFYQRMYSFCLLSCNILSPVRRSLWIIFRGIMFSFPALPSSLIVLLSLFYLSFHHPRPYYFPPLIFTTSAPCHTSSTSFTQLPLLSPDPRILSIPSIPLIPSPFYSSPLLWSLFHAIPYVFVSLCSPFPRFCRRAEAQRRGGQRPERGAPGRPSHILPACRNLLSPWYLFPAHSPDAESNGARRSPRETAGKCTAHRVTLSPGPPSPTAAGPNGRAKNARRPG